VADSSLNIQDYLDASSDASKRTRGVHFIMVIASVLVFAGLINSLHNSWMLARIQLSNDPDSKYVQSKIGKRPEAGRPQHEIDAFARRYQEYYSALMKTYVDTSYVVRVPVFGFTVDANDLGVLGGIAFVIILVVFRFCVSREVDNLRLSFEAADDLDQLVSFYHLLAMRQVFTIPHTERINRTALLLWVPKAFCFAPLFVHVLVVGHDMYTAGVGKLLSDTRTTILFASEGLIFLALLGLTLNVLTRLKRLDDEWAARWPKVERLQNEARAKKASAAEANAVTPPPA
jgi:hypothetical protein